MKDPQQPDDECRVSDKGFELQTQDSQEVRW